MVNTALIERNVSTAPERDAKHANDVIVLGERAATAFFYERKKTATAFSPDQVAEMVKELERPADPLDSLGR